MVVCLSLKRLLFPKMYCLGILFLFWLVAVHGSPIGIWGDSYNSVHFTTESKVLKIDKASKLLTNLAGTDKEGYSGDYEGATSACLGRPEGIWLNPRNNIFLADTNNKRVRTISSSGIITSLAGNGMVSQYITAPATSVSLMKPTGVFGDSTGVLYITDSGSHVVSKLNQGTLTRLVGMFTAGSTNGGAATSSELRSPSGVWVDETTGLMFVADSGNNLLRAVNLKTGASNYNAVPVPGIVSVFGEYSLKHGRTMLYLTSSSNNGVFIYDMLTGVWMALAGGDGTAGDGGNGVHAGFGTLNNPRGIWKEPLVHKNDEDTAYLYLVDEGNNKIRKLTWDLKVYDYYGGQAEIYTLAPIALPTEAPTESPTKNSRVTDSSAKNQHQQSVSVLLIIVITVCVLLLLLGILLCVFRYLYDWPSLPWERHGSPSTPSSSSDTTNQFEFVTYRSLPSGEGTSPI